VEPVDLEPAWIWKTSLCGFETCMPVWIWNLHAWPRVDLEPVCLAPCGFGTCMDLEPACEDLKPACLALCGFGTGMPGPVWCMDLEPACVDLEPACLALCGFRTWMNWPCILGTCCVDHPHAFLPLCTSPSNMQGEDLGIGLRSGWLNRVLCSLAELRTW
jgi:hypothetical protein